LCSLHVRLDCRLLPPDQWATLKLIEVCRGLSEEQLGATAVGTYGSIRVTLRHRVSSEANYAFRLGEAPIRRLPADEPWPGFDVLAEMVSANAAVLTAAARGDSGRVIRLDPDTNPYDSEAAVILVQAFNHATEHRSQICTILTTLGIQPPDMSGWGCGRGPRWLRPGVGPGLPAAGWAGAAGGAGEWQEGTVGTAPAGRVA